MCVCEAGGRYGLFIFEIVLFKCTLAYQNSLVTTDDSTSYKELSPLLDPGPEVIKLSYAQLI